MVNHKYLGKDGSKRSLQDANSTSNESTVGLISSSSPLGSSPGSRSGTMEGSKVRQTSETHNVQNITGEIRVRMLSPFHFMCELGGAILNYFIFINISVSGKFVDETFSTV
jgi:hypothetical protein